MIENGIIINGVVYEFVVCNEVVEGLGNCACDYCALKEPCYRNRDDEPCRLLGENDPEFYRKCFKEWHD